MIKAEANPKTLNCPKCAAVLPTLGLGDSGMMACPNCGTDARVVVFPALFRDEAKPVVAEPVMGDGEASCFFHAGKKAVHPCSGCGRFLCSLCDLASCALCLVRCYPPSPLRPRALNGAEILTSCGIIAANSR